MTLTHTGIWQQQLDEAIDSRAAAILSLRRHLHAYPEPSGEEFETSRYIRQLLHDDGFATQLGPGGRGVIVEGPETSPGPRIALRADIDALRIQDAKQTDYRSRCPGIMHACGHDGHTAVVFGALLGLQALEAAGSLPYPIRWRGIFQPAEETAAGALEMMGAGAIDDIDVILSVHMDPSRAVGRIGLRYGVLCAACDELDVTITGRGGHGARPHESLDPIATAAQFISSIYVLIPRAVDSQDPVVVSIGQFTAGHSRNVIPEEAVLRGTLRTLGGGVRTATKNHIRQLARGTAEASGTRIEVDFGVGIPSVHNDKHLTHLLEKAGTDLLGTDHVDIVPRPSMGGEDFAFYLERIPGAMFRLGCASPRAGSAPLHSPSFDIDERALTIGAKILARAVVLWSDPQGQHSRNHSPNHNSPNRNSPHHE